MTDNILDPQDDNKDYLELMPETQRDPQALAKAKYHADNHIKMLETRMDELRADYLKEREENQARARLEELIQKFENKPLTSNTEPSVKVAENKPTIDVNQIDSLITTKLRENEIARKQTDNANLVKSKLKEHFGDNYTSAVKERIQELDLTEDDFNALAKRSPTAILKSLGVGERSSEVFQSPPRSATGFGSKAQPKKTWSYYQSLKKDNPKLYRDPKITNEMTAAAIELGDAFYDSDFKKYGDAV